MSAELIAILATAVGLGGTVIVTTGSIRSELRRQAQRTCRTTGPVGRVPPITRGSYCGAARAPGAIGLIKGRLLASIIIAGFSAIIVGCATSPEGAAAELEVNPLSRYVDNPDGVVPYMNAIAEVDITDDPSDEMIMEVAAATCRVIDYLLTDEDFHYS